MANRNIKLSFAILTILLVNTGFVLALSVSSPYYKTNPLEMYAGQVKEVSFNLQNCPSKADTCDKGDINVVATLEEGTDIAEITSGTNYKIPYGTADTNLKLKVTIPSGATIGTEYNIKFSVASVPGDSGGVQLGTKYNAEFPIIIKDQSEITTEQIQSKATAQSKTGQVILILAIVIISLIVLITAYVLFKKREQI